MKNIDFLCQNRYNINQLKLFGYSMRLREVKMGGKRSIISLIIVCLIDCMLCGCDKKQDTEKEIGKNGT